MLGGGTWATVNGVGQVAPLTNGKAVVDASLALTVTSAKSCAPTSSVTVTRKTKEPDAGASTVVVASFVVVNAGAPLVADTTLHWYEVIWRLHAATLSLASSVKLWPAKMVSGNCTATAGLEA